MSRVVIDASVAIMWYLPETQSESARGWLERFDAFLVPELFFAEFGKVLRKQVVRAGLEWDIAARIVAATLAFPWRIHSNRRLLTAALSESRSLGLSAYDGYYVALAADSIYALPGTLTGSIGVLAGKPG